MAKSYYITSRQHWRNGDPAQSVAALQAKVRAAVEAEVVFVQVRQMDLTAAAMSSLVQSLVDIRADAKTRLLVNGRADIAAVSGADGVHLSFAELPMSAVRERLPQLQIVGVSCHNEQEVAEAAAAGVDYLLLGPVFETPSKPGAAPLGVERFGKICRNTSIKVFALGGVNRANAAECVCAAGLAASRGCARR